MPEADQAKMGGDGEADSDEETVTVKRKKREKGQGRMTLPETLRREDVYIEPTESTEGCVVIGEEVNSRESSRQMAMGYSIPYSISILALCCLFAWHMHGASSWKQKSTIKRLRSMS
ncbi:hypothetical protein [Nitritalea halalkaliphila]|uniref:hypothetical protein n=1 Tax=Nitritalea halalkaliphila TaxID=590849 RepID=UPI000A0379A9